jgi:hypothetical protein
MTIGIPTLCPLCDSPINRQIKSIIHCRTCDATGVMMSFSQAFWFDAGEVPKAKLDAEKIRQFQETITYNRQARVERILAWNRLNAINLRR